MKKITLLFVCIFFLSTKAFAQSALVLEKKDGTTTFFSLDEKPVLTLNARELVLTIPDVSIEYTLYSKIEKLYFASLLADDVGEIKDGKASFSLSHGELTLKGLSPSSVVRLFSPDGKLLRRMDADEDGYLSIRLLELRTKVVLIKSNELCIKIALK